MMKLAGSEKAAIGKGDHKLGIPIQTEALNQPGFWCKLFKCMFLSVEKILQILSGQDSGPNVRSGACFSG